MQRTFLSYSSADRELVGAIARNMIARGLLPIYDHWWLRSAAPGDLERSRQELQMGIEHADVFVHFNSAASRDSEFVQRECDLAMSRTCSNPPRIRMICVQLDDPDAHVPRWFETTIDGSVLRRDPNALTGALIKHLGDVLDADTPASVRACRAMARASKIQPLRVELQSSDADARAESAILLAFLDERLERPALVDVVRELVGALETESAERAVLALGKLKERAASGIAGLARFTRSDADPYVRAHAVRVLGRIGARDDVVAALVDLATHPHGLTKAAVTELGGMGAAAAVAVPALVPLANSSDQHLRLIALTALGNIGSHHRDVLVAILRALAETERKGISPPQLPYVAMSLLNQLAPTADELADALLPAREESRRFAEWFRGEFPACDQAVRADVASDRLRSDLLACSRTILAGSKFLGRK